MQFGFGSAHSRIVHHCQGFHQQVQSLIHLACLTICLSELGKPKRHVYRCPRSPIGRQSLLHLSQALHALSLRGQRPASEERPQCRDARKPMLCC